MAPFSVIVFSVVVWTIAVSGAKTAPFLFENGLVWTGPKQLDYSLLISRVNNLIVLL